MKNILITLEAVVSYEYSNDSAIKIRILHQTTGKNLIFAANRFAANYLKKRNHIDEWWWCGLYPSVRVYDVTELSDYEFNLLTDIFNGVEHQQRRSKCK